MDISLKWYFSWLFTHSRSKTYSVEHVYFIRSLSKLPSRFLWSYCQLKILIWTCNSNIATPMTKNLLQTQRRTYQMHRYSLLTIRQWQTMVVACQQHSFLMSHRQELLLMKLKLQRKIHNVKVLVTKLKLQRKMRKFDTSTYIAYPLISASSMHVQP